MQNTTNYNFNIVEGTDLVNPLTQLNPNFTALDSLLKGVSDATITTATEVTSGTAHAISRTLPDANVIRFVATSNWITGDTMTIDGTSVTPLKTDGTTLKTGDYIIGATVMLIVDGTRCTVYVASSPDASDINYDNTVSGLTSTKVQGAIDENAAAIDTINSNLTNISNVNLGTYKYSNSTPCTVMWSNNKAVTVNFKGATNLPINTLITIGNLPTGCPVPTLPDVQAMANGPSGWVYLHVSNNGDIQMYSPVATVYNEITLSYVGA